MAGVDALASICARWLEHPFQLLALWIAIITSKALVERFVDAFFRGVWGDRR